MAAQEQQLSIAQLSGNIGGFWSIDVRVTAKTPETGSGHFAVNLTDGTAGIQAVSFDQDTFDQLMEFFEEGQTYRFTGTNNNLFVTDVSHRTHSSFNHEFRICLDQRGHHAPPQLQAIEDNQDIPMYRYENFTRLSDIEDGSELIGNDIVAKVDVCGNVYHVNRTADESHTVKRDLYITDNSTNQDVRLTVWDQKCLQLEGLIQGDVITINDVGRGDIFEFIGPNHNQKQLQTHTLSKVVVNPDVPEATQLAAEMEG